MITALAVWFALAITSLFPQSSKSPHTPIAIIGATLIDGTGKSPIKDSVLIFEDGRIVVAGPRNLVLVPANARIVNGSGKWLIPGLIDMHVHLDEVITPGEFVRWGVTGVRDVGSRQVTIQRWRAMPLTGTAIPHIYWMGRNIDEGTPSWWGAVAVKSAKEVPALLADMERQGVDGVKLYVNAGPDVTRAVITQAHQRGWPVTAHLDKTTSRQAATDGIDNLEHVSQLFLDLKPRSKGQSGFGSGYIGVPQVDLNCPAATSLIKALALHNVAITPTLSVSLMPTLGESGSSSYYRGWSPASVQWKKEWARDYWSFITPVKWSRAQFNNAAGANRKYREMVGKLYRAGVPLVAGTDTPAPWVQPGAGLLVELELMVEFGIPPMEAIRSATSRAAEVLHRDDEIGALTAGRLADFVLLSADPISDIRNLHRIDAVWMNGKPVKR